MKKAFDEVRYLLFDSGVSNYRISQATGIAQSTLSDYVKKKTKVERMPVETAIKLHNYFKEELGEMEKTMWEFERYTVYLESDVLRFENNDGDVLGYVGNIEENDLIEDLNNGADPIADLWEDGVGNTINIDGWGNDEA